MKKKHDFDVVAAMVSNEGKGVFVCSDITECQSRKKMKGGIVSIGVPDPLFQGIINDTASRMFGGKSKYRVCLLVLESDEFEKMQNKLIKK